ncbi:MAG: hypothetical protein AAGN66_18285 [Acidobacteriota bacterium]
MTFFQLIDSTQARPKERRSTEPQVPASSFLLNPNSIERRQPRPKLYLVPQPD